MALWTWSDINIQTQADLSRPNHKVTKLIFAMSSQPVMTVMASLETGLTSSQGPPRVHGHQRYNDRSDDQAIKEWQICNIFKASPWHWQKTGEFAMCPSALWAVPLSFAVPTLAALYTSPSQLPKIIYDCIIVGGLTLPCPHVQSLIYLSHRWDCR